VKPAEPSMPKATAPAAPSAPAAPKMSAPKPAAAPAIKAPAAPKAPAAMATPKPTMAKASLNPAAQSAMDALTHKAKPAVASPAGQAAVATMATNKPQSDLSLLNPAPKKPEPTGNTLNYQQMNAKPASNEANAPVLNYKDMNHPIAQAANTKALKAKLYGKGAAPAPAPTAPKGPTTALDTIQSRQQASKKAIVKADASMIPSNESSVEGMMNKGSVNESDADLTEEKNQSKDRAKSRGGEVKGRPWDLRTARIKAHSQDMHAIKIDKDLTAAKDRQIIKKEIFSPFIPKFAKWDQFAVSFPEFMKNELLLLSKAAGEMGTGYAESLQKTLQIMAMPLKDKKNKDLKLISNPSKLLLIKLAKNLTNCPPKTVEAPKDCQNGSGGQQENSKGTFWSKDMVKSLVKEEWEPKYYKKKGSDNSWANPVNPDKSVSSEQEDSKEFAEDDKHNFVRAKEKKAALDAKASKAKKK